MHLRLSTVLAAVSLAPVFTLVVAPAQDGPYFVNRQAITELNTPATANNFSPTLSEDELYMVFASDRPGGRGGYDLYESRRTGITATWPAPTALTSLNSTENDYEPHLSYNGLELFFVSTRTGGMGVSDIYVTRRTNVTAPWGAVQNVGTPVNGAGVLNDDPYLTQDGLTLFFASDGAGGSDIYTVTRTDIGLPWTNKQPFGAANSSSLDLSPVPEGNGDTVWFASTRAGGNGSSDWYMVHRTGASSWAAPVLVRELNTSAWDSSGWFGGVTRRFYSSCLLGGPSQLYVASPRLEVIWFERHPMAAMVPLVETSPPRTTWRRSWDLRFGAPPSLLRYYNPTTSPCLTALVVSTALTTPPLQFPYLVGSLHVGLQFVAVPVGRTPTDGLVRLPMPVPPNPFLIGSSLHFQSLTVDLNTILGQLSEPGTITFVQ